MTLDEAIKHCEEVAEENEEISLYTPIEFIPVDLSIEKCQECANEHRQLAEWLKELKAYKEQSSDAISRQAVLDIYDDYNVTVENGELEAYRKHRKRLLKLPSVQPEQKIDHWIPVSERLPEKNGNYLVTYEAFDRTARLRYEYVDHYGPAWLHESKHTKALAWMPLPEPYEPQGK